MRGCIMGFLFNLLAFHSLFLLQTVGCTVRVPMDVFPDTLPTKHSYLKGLLYLLLGFSWAFLEA